MYSVLDDPELAQHFQIDPANSWLLAAKEAGIPVFAPGWEDSTMGNMFSANVKLGNIAHHQCVKTGTEQFHHLMDWYLENNGEKEDRPRWGSSRSVEGSPGTSPSVWSPASSRTSSGRHPFWGYFCQITDAEVSYGGYSGAVPNEKITWGKLERGHPQIPGEVRRHHRGAPHLRLPAGRLTSTLGVAAGDLTGSRLQTLRPGMSIRSFSSSI